MNLSPKNAINGKLVKPKPSHRPANLTSPTSPDWHDYISNDDSLDPTELAEIWARRAQILAQKPPTIATGQTITLLVFRLNDELYGIDVTNAREIYPLEQLTPVPRTPDFVAGLFSARGRILSVIDLRTFLGLSTTLPANRRGSAEAVQTKIIVVTNTDSTSETAQMEIGLLADEVTEVRTIFVEDIEASLTTQAGMRANYIRGVTADLLVVLNLNALLNDKQLIIKDEL